MPENKLAELCNQLYLPVVLLGGKEDFQKAENIKQLSVHSIFNGCGKFNLNQSASLVAQANSVITGDTGLMHIAAALKKKVISIWGNTVPEFGMSPYLAHPDSRIFEVKHLSCRPCSRIGFSECPRKHFNCMNLQDPAQIASYTNSLLN